MTTFIFVILVLLLMGVVLPCVMRTLFDIIEGVPFEYWGVVLLWEYLLYPGRFQ